MLPSFSAYLDVIRLAAAIVVFVYHASYAPISGKLFWQISSFGQEAVLVFFTLSGFVVAYSVDVANGGLRRFVINRAARIYSIAIPALILTIVIDLTREPFSFFHQIKFSDLFSGFDHNPILNGLFFTGELWGNHIEIGSDGPYWSLGFEVWYYAAFAALFFAPRYIGVSIAAGIFLLTGPVVTSFFLTWIFGLLAYRTTKNVYLGFYKAFLAAFGSLIVAVIIVRYFGPMGIIFAKFTDTATPYAKYGYYIGLAALFSVHLVGMSSLLAHVPQISPKWRACARHLGDQTFTLYLFHMPLMILIAEKSPWPASSWQTRLMIFVGVPLIIVPIAVFLERQKPLWRRIIAMLVDGLISLYRTKTRAAQ